MDRVHRVVHGPGPWGGPWTPVHVLYMSHFPTQTWRGIQRHPQCNGYCWRHCGMWLNQTRARPSLLQNAQGHSQTQRQPELWKVAAQADKSGFLWTCLAENGIQPAKEKLEAIRNMKTPSNMKELQTNLGMVTYLNRFSTKLAALTSPLRELTKKHVHFSWVPRH